MKLVERVLGVNYHRNGICGTGFYLVDFIFAGDTDKNGWDTRNRQRLSAVYVLPHDEEGEISDKADAEAIFVTDPFDITNRWRGDNFAEEIHTICVNYFNEKYGEALGTKS